jgi:hypothetical protein
MRPRRSDLDNDTGRAPERNTLSLLGTSIPTYDAKPARLRGTSIEPCSGT